MKSMKRILSYKKQHIYGDGQAKCKLYKNKTQLSITDDNDKQWIEIIKRKTLYNYKTVKTKKKQGVVRGSRIMDVDLFVYNFSLLYICACVYEERRVTIQWLNTTQIFQLFNYHLMNGEKFN